MTATTEPSFRFALDAYVQEQQETGRWCRDVHVTVAGSLRHALEVIGDRPVADVTRDHVRAYRRWLQATPTRIGRSRVASGINQELGYLSSAMIHAGRERWINFNPVQGLRVEDGRHGQELRLPYTPGELKQLFSRAYASPEAFGRSAGWYWLPLICLASGLRNEEAAALRGIDVSMVEGIWAFHVRPDSDRVKTPAAVRAVPIHPTLLALGFTTHLAHSGVLSTQRTLFSDLRLTARGSRTDRLSRFWNRTWLGEFEINRATHSFYSLRHTFKTMLDDLGDVPLGTTKALMGHADGDVTSGRYGRRTALPTLQAVINRVDLSFLEELPGNYVGAR